MGKCSECGREVPQLVKGLCKTHYNHQLSALAGKCAVIECGQDVVAKGWCNLHYRSWKKTGDPLATIRVPRTGCEVGDCDRPHAALGYCQGHYWRLTRYGDPLYVAPPSLVQAHLREYRVWQSAKARTSNPRHAAWKNYGGRGLVMCPHLVESFEAFMAEVGERPEPDWQVERIDNEKGYLCRSCNGGKTQMTWKDRGHQLQNRRTWSSTGFKGVVLKKARKGKGRAKYEARISVNGQRLHVGTADTPEEAARFYDVAAIKYYGPEAKTNFPPRRVHKVKRRYAQRQQAA